MRNPFNKPKPYTLTGKVEMPGWRTQDGKPSDVAIQGTLAKVYDFFGGHIDDFSLFSYLSEKQLVEVNRDLTVEQTVFSSASLEYAYYKAYKVKLDNSTIDHLKVWYEQKSKQFQEQRDAKLEISDDETEEVNVVQDNDDENAEV